MELAQVQMASPLESIKVQGSDRMRNHPATVVHLHDSIQMEKEAEESPKESSIGTVIPLQKARNQFSSVCRCVCCKRRRRCTPYSTQDWLDGLSVTFSEIGPLSCDCTVPSCLQNLSPSASIDLTLPSWLASSIVSVGLKSTPIQGPELLLRPRIIETPAYYTAEQGSLAALRQLYAEHRAETHDANPVSGQNTLFDGVFRGHLDVVRFLLDSGADMEMSDFCGFTPRDLACQRVNAFCPPPTPELAAQLHSLFRLDEVPDDLDFITAYRIVLGMSILALNEYLSERPEDLDKPDLLGWTPLWWAIRRDGLPRSHAFLAHGANPNIAKAASRSPLHNAAAQASPELVDTMLAHGSDVHQRSFEGKTPLQVVGAYGVRECGAVIVVDQLLDAGADVNAKDSYGRTQISLYCFDSHVEIARVLLERGADVLVPDGPGLAAIALGHL